MVMKIICTIISAAFAAGVYAWGDILDHQMGSETWVFRLGVTLLTLSVGTHFICMEDDA